MFGISREDLTYLSKAQHTNLALSFKRDISQLYSGLRFIEKRFCYNKETGLNSLAASFRRVI